MSSRQDVLARIRERLASDEPVELPPPPEIWPADDSPPAELADRFTKELAEVHGEVVRCASMEEAQAKLVELVSSSGWESLGAVESRAAREFTEELDEGTVRWAPSVWEAPDMAGLSAGLGDTVKLAFIIVSTAHHGEDVPGFRLHHNHRALKLSI